MKSYYTKKEEIRNQAIIWQIQQAGESLSYSELFEKQCYFEDMGRKYGLLREFRENGIL